MKTYRMKLTLSDGRTFETTTEADSHERGGDLALILHERRFYSLVGVLDGPLIVNTNHIVSIEFLDPALPDGADVDD